MRFFLVLFLICGFVFPAQAQEQHTQVRLYSPQNAVGSTADIPAAVEITLEDGWKTYWRTPGDAGLPPDFNWEGSENLDHVSIAYPAPYRFTIFDIDNFGYKHKVTFPLTLVPMSTGVAMHLKLDLDILVCSDICVPESHHLTLDLPAGTAEQTSDLAFYEAALQHIPAQNDTRFSFAGGALATDHENRNYLIVTGAASAALTDDADLFIEATDSDIVFGKPEISFDSDTSTASFKTPIHSTTPIDKLTADLAKNPLTLTLVDQNLAIEGTLDLGATSGMAPAVLPAQETVIQALNLHILLLALLGGLILNLMPCVLPVLSLKILSVVSHGGKESRKDIFRNFMASAIGILVSFWLMAGVLSVLKSTGETIGWGIQFQHSGFLIFLIVIVLLFAANMWGLFEVPLPRFIARHASKKQEGEPTLAGHFFTGMFATLLATPCTAPFLGTAIGFALAGSTTDIFSVFTFLGLGLALPYIALALSPRLFKYMPRPGKWMLHLKKILAIALLATALWLGNVLISVTTQPTLDMGWHTFNQTLIAPALEEGKTVFVDVTADWCLTCKANKRLVLESDDVQNWLAAENIVKLQADWTQRDENIAAYLQSFGRYGIPFNVVYGPAAPEGIVLPELLTKAAVQEALVNATGE